MSIENMQRFPNKWKCPPKKSGLTIQCDEMWSFVGDQGNKQWIWLALDVNTREIVGAYIGVRSELGAQVKLIRKPSIRLIIAPFPDRQRDKKDFFFQPFSQTLLTSGIQA